VDKSGLLKRLERAWEELKDSYADLGEQELLESGVTGDWSVKDVIAHVSSWEEEALTYLPVILEGGKPPKYSVLYGGIDAFNARMTQKSRKLSLSEVIQKRDFIHAKLLEFIREVKQEYFLKENRFRRRLRLDTYGHYREHAQAIRSWKEKKAQSCCNG